MCAKSLHSCPTLGKPVDCSLPDSFIHGMLRARIQESIAMPSFKGSPQPHQGSNPCLQHLLNLEVGSLSLVPPEKRSRHFAEFLQIEASQHPALEVLTVASKPLPVTNPVTKLLPHPRINALWVPSGQTGAAWCLYSWDHSVCACLFYLASFAQHCTAKFTPVLCLDVVHWLRCFSGSVLALLFRGWWAHESVSLRLLQTTLLWVWEGVAVLGVHTGLGGVRPGEDLPGCRVAVYSSLLMLLTWKQEKEHVVPGAQKEAPSHGWKILISASAWKQTCPLFQQLLVFLYLIYYFKFIYLAAAGLSCSTWDLFSCGMWDPVP